MIHRPDKAVRFWQELLGFLEAGEPVFLAMVVEHTRHSPGTTGARMLVRKAGEPVGTIGGGAMEHRLLDYARATLQDAGFKPELRTLHHRKKGPGEKSGMICAGSQTNLYLVCRPQRDLRAIEKLLACTEAARPATLRIEPSGLTVLEHEAGEAKGLTRTTEGWVYEEPALNPRRLAIVGGGHCALALSRVMYHLGYAVTVFDTRPGVFTLQQNEYARTVVVPDYRDAGALIEAPERTPAVVMTTDAVSDVRGLMGLLPLPVPFLGVMGSRAKLAFISERLREAGYGEADFARLSAPVGLPIGSHTPEEIAVSVAAHLIQNREARDGNL